MKIRAKTVAWFSGGVTSAIACKLAIDEYENLDIVYIETGSHHSDHERFLRDCEKWYNKKITVIRSEIYQNVFDVINRTRFINSPRGASCTGRLKKNVRCKYEQDNPGIKVQVFGFEYDKKEQNRANRHEQRYPEFQYYFPLIELQLTKRDCLDLLEEAKIQVPMMYRLGYLNSNCIGCVKGGMSYWNKIRQDFPHIFDEMSKRERERDRPFLSKKVLFR